MNLSLELVILLLIFTRQLREIDKRVPTEGTSGLHDERMPENCGAVKFLLPRALAIASMSMNTSLICQICHYFGGFSPSGNHLRTILAFSGQFGLRQ